jgi:uncharacterized protein
MRRHHFRIATLAGLLVLAGIGHGPACAADTTDPLPAAETELRRGDVSQAMAVLRQAANRGHSGAQARLADLLRAAEFNQEALALYRQSAAQGDPAGEFGLGRMYADGLGVPRDAAQALAWYRRAEQQQHAPALDALARAYRSGDLGLPRDLAAAAELDARAALARQAPRRDTP